MIECVNLTKSFKRVDSTKNKNIEKFTAIDHINFTIKKGEIYGFIGPNGAGKTTTLKILSTLIIPDEGTATIDGLDVVQDSDKVKNKIGYLAGEFVRSFYWRLSARENLKFFANLRGIWKPDQRIDYLLDLFKLTQQKNELVMKYSTGMKHKLALAAGLLHDPPVLLLDEPLTGIDPVTSYDIKELIKTEFKDKTIIWASHNLFEVEEMCDKIIMVNKGRIILEGEPETLKRNHWNFIKVIVISDRPDAFSSLQNAEINNKTIEIKTNNIKKTFSEIYEIVNKQNIEIIDIRTVKPSLEEIFMEGIKND
jgi:ABC-2 type transport system ATP-binding protein